MPKPMIVERHGWRVEILPEEPRKRPRWEIRCEINRTSETASEWRGHRFFVPEEVAAELGLDRLPAAKREERMCRAVKRIVMRELGEIFSEPEGGLDSVRPIPAADLAD